MSQHRPPTKSFEDNQEECLAKGLGPPNAITDLDSDSEPEAEEIVEANTEVLDVISEEQQESGFFPNKHLSTVTTS